MSKHNFFINKSLILTYHIIYLKLSISLKNLLKNSINKLNIYLTTFILFLKIKKLKI